MGSSGIGHEGRVIAGPATPTQSRYLNRWALFFDTIEGVPLCKRRPKVLKITRLRLQAMAMGSLTAGAGDFAQAIDVRRPNAQARLHLRADGLRSRLGSKDFVLQD